ncbi:hypothetical protein COR50_16050 [Chitinophaga caeni]|uniref:Capsular polysaccharide assembling protein CapF C-terminal domain-containing protein n=1 Tax=Chitinophaga caeni TaxID=2029983 RepID=A0A291QXE7_9BACT|nr:hypothetical protein [Chitinophaga caeni]ATL48552.1 hypothetical protein COR50_16050 [Chitinophaga caeni]
MIQVETLELQGQDERGSNYNWDCSRKGNFILCYRKAGTTSGQHYHEGKNANKNPEIMFLLEGECWMHWSHLEQRKIESIRVKAPARIEIPSMLWHELEAISDCTFIELNSIADVREDSIRVWREDFVQGK